MPPLETYADKLWDYWERNLDPDLFKDRTLVGAVRGRRGLVSGIGPDRSSSRSPTSCCGSAGGFSGRASLEAAVRGKVVLITGASSGIGKATALKSPTPAATVLLVARSAEKLEETKDEIEAGGGIAHIHRCDLSDIDDIERMAEEVLA